MTALEAKKLTAVLIGAFPHSRVSPETPGIYERMLLDVDHEVGAAVVKRLVASEDWLPTIAKILRLCAQLKGGKRPDAEEAWESLHMMVRSVGIYRSPRFSDKLLERAMTGVFGNWRAFCNSPENDAAGRARFLDYYNRLVERELTDEVSGVALPARSDSKRLSGGDGARVVKLLENAVKTPPGPVTGKPGETQRRGLAEWEKRSG